MIINSPAPSETDNELETALKKLHDLESIITRSPVIFCVWRFVQNAPMEYVTGNISQWGYTPGDFLSGRMTWGKLIHPDDFDRIQSEIFCHAKKKTACFDQSYRILNCQGDV